MILILNSSCDLRTPKEYYNLAFDLEEKGEYEKAIKYLDKAINKNPNFRLALLNRGAAKAKLEDYDGAIEDYERILNFDSDNTAALVNIGNNYGRLDEYNKAISYFTKALNTKGATEPNKPIIMTDLLNWDKDSDFYISKIDIYLKRGIYYAKSQEYEKAVWDLKQVDEYDYKRAKTEYWLGKSHLRLGNNTKAKRYLLNAYNLGVAEAKELLKEIENNK